MGGRHVKRATECRHRGLVRCGPNVASWCPRRGTVWLSRWDALRKLRDVVLGRHDCRCVEGKTDWRVSQIYQLSRKIIEMQERYEQIQCLHRQKELNVFVWWGHWLSPLPCSDKIDIYRIISKQPGRTSCLT